MIFANLYVNFQDHRTLTLGNGPDRLVFRGGDVARIAELLGGLDDLIQSDELVGTNITYNLADFSRDKNPRGDIVGVPPSPAVGEAAGSAAVSPDKAGAQ